MDFVSTLSYPQIKPKKLPIKLKPETKPKPKSKSKPKTKPKPKPKKDRMNFEKTLLDAPIKRKRTVRDNNFIWFHYRNHWYQHHMFLPNQSQNNVD